MKKTILFIILLLVNIPLIFASKFVLVGHLYSIQNEEDIQDLFVEQINNIKDADGIIFLGDVVRGGTKEEWDYMNSRILSRLNAKKFFVPGNHDVYQYYSKSNRTSGLDVYLNNTGYLAKKIKYNDSTIYLLDSVNAKGVNFSEEDMINGGGLSPESIKLLKNLDSGKINLIFLHHVLFSSTLPPVNEKRTIREKEWNETIVPLIKGKVAGVFMGDGNINIILNEEREGIKYYGNTFASAREDLRYTIVTINKGEEINVQTEYIKMPDEFKYKYRYLRYKIKDFLKRALSKLNIFN